jgi:hypothetical protein
MTGLSCLQDQNGKFVGVAYLQQVNLNANGQFLAPNYTMTITRYFGSTNYQFQVSALEGVLVTAVFYYAQPNCQGYGYVADDDSRVPQPLFADEDGRLWYGAGEPGTSVNLVPQSMRDGFHGPCQPSNVVNLQAKPAQVIDGSWTWVMSLQPPFSNIDPPANTASR